MIHEDRALLIATEVLGVLEKHGRAKTIEGDLAAVLNVYILMLKRGGLLEDPEAQRRIWARVESQMKVVLEKL